MTAGNHLLGTQAVSVQNLEESPEMYFNLPFNMFLVELKI